jgi:hypothetical protein
LCRVHAFKKKMYLARCELSRLDLGTYTVYPSFA